MANFYPHIFSHLLSNLVETERLRQYTERCKLHEYDYNKYSLFVHGYLMPWFEKQRAENRFNYSKKKLRVNDIIERIKINMNGQRLSYLGEFDENKRPCGRG